MKISLKFTMAASALALLAACGGGGGGSNTTVLSSEISILKEQNFNYSDKGQAGYVLRSGTLVDLNNDGINEFVLTLTSYPNQIEMPTYVLGYDGNSVDLTSKYFGNSIPSVKHSPFVIYKDITGDGKEDLVFAEAGLDNPPWTGSKISVSIREGAGFRNVTSLLPDTTNRNYATAVGNFTGTGNSILVQDSDTQGVGDGKIITWKNGEFKFSPNPVSSWRANENYTALSFSVADFNKDGFDDLLLAGNWVGRTNNIIYGASNGLQSNAQNVLPAGPLTEGGWSYNHTGGGFPFTQDIISAENVSYPVDVDGDGLVDIVTTSSEFNYYLKTGFYFGKNVLSVWKNKDGINFESINTVDLGLRFFHTLIPFDINKDGKMDLIGLSTDQTCINSNCGKADSTFLINDGKGKFKIYEAINVFPEILVDSMIGAIIPLKIDTNSGLAMQILTNGTRKSMTVRSFSFNSNRLTNLK
jgi:hypothetical protein